MPGRIEVTFEPRVKKGAGVRLFGGAAFPDTGIACLNSPGSMAGVGWTGARAQDAF